MKLKLFFVLWLGVLSPAWAQGVGSVFIEDMTWVEVRNRVAQGAQIAIIPIGGIEQGGQHLTLGKHNFIVRFAAADIARIVGNVLVAPVIPFSPSGRIYPPEGHMQFAGTLSMRPETLAMVIEDVASSLKQHGVRLICLIGDNAGSQHIQQQMADRLSSQWSSEGVRVLHISDYFAQQEQEEWAMNNGAMTANPTAHAGMVETSELMAVAAHQVRTQAIGAFSESDYQRTGAAGDATQASATLGRSFLAVKVNAAVAQIKQAAARGGV